MFCITSINDVSTIQNRNNYQPLMHETTFSALFWSITFSISHNTKRQLPFDNRLIFDHYVQKNQKTGTHSISLRLSTRSQPKLFIFVFSFHFLANKSPFAYNYRYRGFIMVIAICDDDTLFTEQLSSYLKQFLNVTI